MVKKYIRVALHDGLYIIAALILLTAVLSSFTHAKEVNGALGDGSRFTLSGEDTSCLTDCQAVVNITAVDDLSIPVDSITTSFSNESGDYEIDSVDTSVAVSSTEEVAMPVYGDEPVQVASYPNGTVVTQMQRVVIGTYNATVDITEEEALSIPVVSAATRLQLGSTRLGGGIGGIRPLPPAQPVTLDIPAGESRLLTIKGTKSPWDSVEWTACVGDACLDPWWSGSWNRCRAMGFYDLTATARVNEPVTINITDLTFANASKELRILQANSAACTDWVGSEVPYTVDLTDNGAAAAGHHWAIVSFLANKGAVNFGYYDVYYDSATATYPNYPNRVIFSENFNETLNASNKTTALSTALWDTASATGTWSLSNQGLGQGYIINQTNGAGASHQLPMAINLSEAGMTLDVMNAVNAGGAGTNINGIHIFAQGATAGTYYNAQYRLLGGNYLWSYKDDAGAPSGLNNVSFVANVGQWFNLTAVYNTTNTFQFAAWAPNYSAVTWTPVSGFNDTAYTSGRIRLNSYGTFSAFDNLIAYKGTLTYKFYETASVPPFAFDWSIGAEEAPPTPVAIQLSTPVTGSVIVDNGVTNFTVNITSATINPAIGANNATLYLWYANGTYYGVFQNDSNLYNGTNGIAVAYRNDYNYTMTYQGVCWSNASVEYFSPSNYTVTKYAVNASARDELTNATALQGNFSFDNMVGGTKFYLGSALALAVFGGSANLPQGTNKVTGSSSGYGDRHLFAWINGTSYETLNYYLIPLSSASLFAFIVRNTAGAPLSGNYTINKTVSGTSVVLTEGYTDNSGNFAEYLHAGDTYTFTVRSAGCADYTTSLTVGASPYTFFLPCNVINTINGPGAFNMSWETAPGTRAVYNGTATNFTLHVWTMPSYNTNITNIAECFDYMNGSESCAYNATGLNYSWMWLVRTIPNEDYVTVKYNFTTSDWANTSWQWKYYITNTSSVWDITSPDFNVSILGAMVNLRLAVDNRAWLALGLVAILATVLLTASLGLGAVGSGLIFLAVLGTFVLGFGLAGPATGLTGLGESFMSYALFGLTILVVIGAFILRTVP